MQKSDEEGLDREAMSVMIVTTPPSRGVRSRKNKWEIEEVSPSAEAVSEKKLKETAPMVLSRWKTATYKSNSITRKLAEVLIEMEAATTSCAEEDFKPQKMKAKRGSNSGKMWEVDVGKEWISDQHLALVNMRQVTPLRKC